MSTISTSIDFEDITRDVTNLSRRVGDMARMLFPRGTGHHGIVIDDGFAGSLGRYGIAVSTPVPAKGLSEWLEGIVTRNAGATLVLSTDHWIAKWCLRIDKNTDTGVCTVAAIDYLGASVVGNPGLGSIDSIRISPRTGDVSMDGIRVAPPDDDDTIAF